MTLPENPIPYDDDAYTQALTSLQDAISDLWNAGGTLDNIRGELGDALENATGSKVRVEMFDA